MGLFIAFPFLRQQSFNLSQQITAQYSTQTGRFPQKMGKNSDYGNIPEYDFGEIRIFHFPACKKNGEMLSYMEKKIMGGRGSGSKGIAFFVRQNALAWARSQIGSTDYAKSAELGNWGANAWKCNAFVIRAFNYNVIPEVIGPKENPMTLGLTQVPYRAKDFYEGKVPGFVEVKSPQPGDICADGSHMGIVSGKGETISAAKDRVVENDWGFRKNAKRKSKFFRYVGTKKKSSSKKE